MNSPVLPSLIAPGIDDLYRRQVLYPWERECHLVEFPWRATPELRGHWLEMVSSKDEAAREVGAIALMRCSRQTREEKIPLRQFWQTGGFRLINTDLALSQLLQGASPPGLLFDLYFSRHDISFFQANPFARELLSRLTRHPALGELANLLVSSTSMYGSGMAWGINPSLAAGLAAPLAEHQNPWIRAAGFFQPQNFVGRLAPALPAAGTLGIAGILLRPQLTPQEFEMALSKTMPEDVFEFLMLDHPAGNGRTCPALDWSDPGREAIEFCGEQTYLGALWRDWNPTLTLPWLFDDLSGIEDPGFLAARVLLGAPPEILSQGMTLDIGLLRRLRGDYPCLQVEPT